MLFTSLPFVILVLITLLLYYLPWFRSAQVWLLTAASFLFYAWDAPALVILLVASILINVVTSYQVSKGRPAWRKFWALTGVGLNLGLLFIFKYGPLVSKTLFDGDHGSIGHFLVTIPLPIGISFFTFQGISLVVEVFRSKQPHQPGDLHYHPEMVADTFTEHLKHTMLFKAFFPSLVAGPIIKAHQFYPQIVPKKFSRIDWPFAFRSLVVGYFLKMVIADNLKDSTFWIEYPYFLKESPLTLITLLFGYSIQIFADFAGYSLIAMGLSALFGYVLPQNFNYPYIARSFGEFWRRWHISLSTWLREYLYLPLGGNRRGAFRTYFNLFVVMFLGGLWHGAAWSYAIWGSFHGLALAAERYGNQFIRFPKHWLVDVLQALAVFSFVTLAWLLFKLPKLEHVLAYLSAMFTSSAETRYWLVAHVVTYSLPVIGYYAWYLIKERWPGVGRGDSFVFGTLLVAIILDSGTNGAFIYFQF